MTEEEMFNLLLSKDPTPGIKNRVIRENGIYKVPGWVFDSKEEFINVKYKNIKERGTSKFNITGQIIYDILNLGLLNIQDRPKCPICGTPVIYDSFSRGYYKTCGSKTCKSEYARIEVSNLWKDQKYRNQQSNSHIEWAKDIENKEKMRQRSLKCWEDPDYREMMSKAHIEWAKDEIHRQQMRDIANKLWNTPEFVEKMMKRVDTSGIRGSILCSKSTKGVIFFDSSWERDFIQFCNSCDEILKFERADFHIMYEYLGENRMYFPDFLITLKDERTILVEVKSDWLLESDEKTQLKLDAGENYVKTCNDIDEYVVLFGLDIYENLGYSVVSELKLKSKLKII